MLRGSSQILVLPTKILVYNVNTLCKRTWTEGPFHEVLVNGAMNALVYFEAAAGTETVDIGK